ncbi:MAG: hypothetical protein KTR28_06510 [Micavibrio sp.]|nr:hypothetical protein [Micavibrio sp.]
MGDLTTSGEQDKRIANAVGNALELCDNLIPEFNAAASHEKRTELGLQIGQNIQDNAGFIVSEMPGGLNKERLNKEAEPFIRTIHQQAQPYCPITIKVP